MDQRITIYMTNYINQALHKFQYPLNQKPTNSKSKYKAPTYGAKKQYGDPKDTRKLVPPSNISHNQQVISTLI